jgi:hypothetical protein
MTQDRKKGAENDWIQRYQESLKCGVKTRLINIEIMNISHDIYVCIHNEIKQGYMYKIDNLMSQWSILPSHTKIFKYK